MGNITYEDLFLGILAMDVYHRGYNSSLKDLGETGSIGTATIRNTTKDSNSGDGFYAIRYDWAGKDVYVYRGTDEGFTSGNDKDKAFGTALGHPNTPQGRLAIDFYTETAGREPAGSDVVVVGQSMGGGLAGYVASLFGAEAAIFNHMPFELATSNAYSLAVGSKTATQIYAEFAALWFALPAIIRPFVSLEAMLLHPIDPRRNQGTVYLFPDIRYSVPDLDWIRALLCIENCILSLYFRRRRRGR